MKKKTKFKTVQIVDAKIEIFIVTRIKTGRFFKCVFVPLLVLYFSRIFDIARVEGKNIKFRGESSLFGISRDRYKLHI